MSRPNYDTKGGGSTIYAQDRGRPPAAPSDGRRHGGTLESSGSERGSGGQEQRWEGRSSDYHNYPRTASGTIQRYGAARFGSELPELRSSSGGANSRRWKSLERNEGNRGGPEYAAEYPGEVPVPRHGDREMEGAIEAAMLEARNRHAPRGEHDQNVSIRQPGSGPYTHTGPDWSLKRSQHYMPTRSRNSSRGSLPGQVDHPPPPAGPPRAGLSRPAHDHLPAYPAPGVPRPIHSNPASGASSPNRRWGSRENLYMLPPDQLHNSLRVQSYPSSPTHPALPSHAHPHQHPKDHDYHQSTRPMRAPEANGQSLPAEPRLSVNASRPHAPSSSPLKISQIAAVSSTPRSQGPSRSNSPGRGPGRPARNPMERPKIVTVPPKDDQAKDEKDREKKPDIGTEAPASGPAIVTLTKASLSALEETMGQKTQGKRVGMSVGISLPDGHRLSAADALSPAPSSNKTGASAMSRQSRRASLLAKRVEFDEMSAKTGKSGASAMQMSRRKSMGVMLKEMGGSRASSKKINRRGTFGDALHEMDSRAATETNRSTKSRLSYVDDPLLTIRLYVEDVDLAVVQRLEATLDHIEKNTPKKTGLPKCLQRTALYADAFTLVAEHAEIPGIMGLVSGCVKEMRLGENVVRVGYGYDLLLHPQHNVGALAAGLAERLRLEFRRRSAEYHYMLLSPAYGDDFGVKHHLSSYGSFAVHCWPVTDRKKCRVQVGEVKEKTEGETMELLRLHFSLDQMFPSDLDAFLFSDKHLGTLTLSEGNSDAGLCVWDSTAQTRADKLWGQTPALVRVEACLFNCLASCVRDPRLRLDMDFTAPPRGRMLYGCFARGSDGRQLFEELVAFVHNLAYDEGVELMSCVIPADAHNLAAALPSWSSLTDSTLCLVGSLDPSLATPEQSGRLFCDPRDF